MRRFLGPAVAVVVAVVLGLLVAFLWRSVSDESRAPEELSSQILISTRVNPRVHGIGDRIEAEVVVLADTTVVDPDTIRPLIDYEPYDTIGPVQRTVTKEGSVARFSYRQALMCVAEACAPSEDAPITELPTGTVFYRFRQAPRPVGREIEWPQMTLVERASGEEVEGGVWRVDAPAITPVSFRFNPGWLAALLFGASLAFLLVAAAIVWQFVERRREPEVEPVVDTRSPLERALDAARLASLNGAVPERRRALERVARELSSLGEDELAARARTLAWSPDGASRQAVEDFARDARAAVSADSREVEEEVVA